MLISFQKRLHCRSLPKHFSYSKLSSPPSAMSAPSQGITIFPLPPLFPPPSPSASLNVLLLSPFLSRHPHSHLHQLATLPQQPPINLKTHAHRPYNIKDLRPLKSFRPQPHNRRPELSYFLCLSSLCFFPRQSSTLLLVILMLRRWILLQTWVDRRFIRIGSVIWCSVVGPWHCILCFVEHCADHIEEGTFFGC